MAAKQTLCDASATWRDEFLSDLRAIRTKGKAADLSDDRIDELFFESRWIEETAPLRIAARNVTKAITVCLYAISLLLCLAIAVNQIDCVSTYFGDFAQVIEHPFVRVTRKLAVRTGFNDWLSSFDFYSSGCLLDNPLYEEPKAPCVAECLDPLFHEYFPDDAPALRKLDYPGTTRVFIYRSRVASRVSLSGIQRVLHPHAEEVVKRARVLASNAPGFASLDDLLEAPNAEALLDGAEDALVTFGSSHYNVSRHFRSVFPRAPFVPSEAEVDLEKTVLAFRRHPERKFRLWAQGAHVGHAWIHQARGTDCFLVRPKNECSKAEKSKRKRDRRAKGKPTAETTGEEEENNPHDNKDNNNNNDDDSDNNHNGLDYIPNNGNSYCDNDGCVIGDKSNVYSCSNDGNIREKGNDDEVNNEVNNNKDVAGDESDVNSDPGSDPCPTYSFRLDDGDFAYLNGYFWSARVQPCEDDDVESEENNLDNDNDSDGRSYGLVYLGLFS